MEVLRTVTIMCIIVDIPDNITFPDSIINLPGQLLAASLLILTDMTVDRTYVAGPHHLTKAVSKFVFLTEIMLNHSVEFSETSGIATIPLINSNSTITDNPTRSIFG